MKQLRTLNGYLAKTSYTTLVGKLRKNVRVYGVRRIALPLPRFGYRLMVSSWSVSSAWRNRITYPNDKVWEIIVEHAQKQVIKEISYD